MKRSAPIIVLLVGLVTLGWGPLLANEFDTSKLKALKPRSIGPAAMSGRVTAIAVAPHSRDVIYVGSASGGLWRSTDGGTTWKPILDDQGASSIGAVAIDPLNPDVIWVGTGEGNPRNSQNIGDGIYKSIDGGRSWKHLGLRQSEHIHRILIHPHRTEVVYVASLGPTWGDGEERGVFKTTDGGQTWEKVLYVDQRTGAADLVMDPLNPDKLIAALWEHRRTPAYFTSGGPGSGIYLTYDGGKEWKKRTAEDGLPKGNLGRIGLAIAHNRPEIVYALVEAKKNALYRSEDGGQKWAKVNDKDEVGNRPFYYSDLRVDPQNENRVISIHSLVSISEDGGKSFKVLIPFSKIHPDHHAFWIDPQNPRFMIDGNDGGLAISRDGGKNWRFVENLPLGQFYHISVDDAVPFNIYGGLQDNGSFMGPSQVWESGVGGNGGILNSHWQMVSFGDGFDVVPDPSDDRYGYSMSQGGYLYRFDKLTRTSRLVRPPEPEDGIRLRFNWNAGIAADPFEKGTIYYGSQFVHRSADQGRSWQIISPDLTSNDPERQKQLDSGGLTYDVTGAENNTTIVAIAPSPVQQGVIWVGTDDGNVQVTRDGGRNWTNVAGNIRGVPAGTWVPHIEASKFEAGEAFAVFDDHRRGNFTPYAYRTSDFGKTWTSLVSDQIRGHAYVIEQDPVAANLLFLGTEFHLYMSLDGGRSWTKWDQGYPTVPTMDLVIHPRDPDLVIGTFGRAIWIIDDITPLRVMAQQGTEVLQAPLRLFQPVPAYQAVYGSSSGELIPGDAAFRGENRPQGVLLTYVVTPPEGEEKAEEPEEAEEVAAAEAEGESGEEPEEPADTTPQPKKPEVKIEILQGDQVIRTLKGPAETGLNRVNWELDRKRPRFPSRSKPQPDAPEPGGVPVLPGEYTARVTFGEHQETRQVTVLWDPRLETPRTDLEARNQFFDEFIAEVEKATELADRLREAKEKMDRVDSLMKDRPKGEKAEAAGGEETSEESTQALQDAAKAARESLKQLDEKMFSKEVQGIRRDPETLRSYLFNASGYAQSSWDAPSPSERKAVRDFEAKLRDLQQAVDAFFEKEWEAYRQAVQAAELKVF